MQRMGCVEVTPISGENLEAYQKQDVTRLPQVETTMERLRWDHRPAFPVQPAEAALPGQPADADAGTCSISSSMRQNSWHLLDQAEELEKTAATCAGQLARIQVAQEQLEPWKGLDIPVENIVSTRSVFQQVGTISKGLVEELIAKYAAQPVYIQVLGEVRDVAYIWVVAHSVPGRRARGSAEGRQLYARHSLGICTVLWLSAWKAYRQEREEINGRAQAVTQEWQEMANANLTRLKTWYDLLQIEKDQQEAAKRTIGTGRPSASGMGAGSPGGQGERRAAEALAHLLGGDLRSCRG